MGYREDDDSFEHSMTRILNSLNEERKYFNQLRKELNMGGGQLRRNLDCLISRGQIFKQTIGKHHYFSLTSPSSSPLD
jgi:DNA-binding HxlR family transcriptional regulator